MLNKELNKCFTFLSYKNVKIPMLEDKLKKVFLVVKKRESVLQ